MSSPDPHSASTTSSARSWAAAVALVAGSVAARLLFQPWLGDTVPYITFFPAVLIAGRIGGLGPGVLATILSGAASWAVVPRAGTPNQDALALGIFLGTGTFIAWISGRLRQSLRELSASLTERGETARALEESSRLNAEILGSIRDGVAGIDRDWRYIYVNEQAARLLGKTSDELLGRAVRETWPETGGSDSEARMLRAMGGEIEQWDVARENGMALAVTAYPARSGITVYLRDVTAERAAAQAIVEAQERYRALFDTALDGIAILDDRSYYVEVNESFARLVKTTPDELRGRRFGDAIPRESARRAAEAHDTLKQSGAAAAQFAIRASDGSGVEVEWRARANVRPGLHLWVGRDITERESLTRQIAQERSTLAMIVGQLPSGVIVADGTGKLTLTNDRVREIWRQDPFPAANVDEYRRYRAFHSDGRLYHPEDWPLARALRGETVRNLEIEIERGDGTRGFISNNAAPLRDGAGALTGAVVVFDDVTERKRLEEQLRQSAKLESLGVLAGGIAHDFNNLLVGILGNASLLHEHVQPGAGTLMLEELVRASQRLSDLTTQLLAYAGKGRLELRALDISEVAREITELVRASTPKRAQLRLSLGNGLPAVMGDAAQLQQVIMNLVINAAEAIPEGRQGTVRLTTAVREVAADSARTDFGAESIAPGRYCSIEVADDGVGMDRATLEKIFDPFFTTKFAGRGLGLAAVLGIIKGHGGALDVASTPGVGSTFTVLLPASEASLLRTAAPEEDLRGTGTVLVIDDEAVVRILARNALERYGYSVLGAEGGRQGVEQYQAHREEIALVLMDLTMPEMGGEETYDALRMIDPEVRVLLSSGYNEAEARRRFEDRAVAGFIQKPYTAKELARAVRSAVG